MGCTSSVAAPPARGATIGKAKRTNAPAKGDHEKLSELLHAISELKQAFGAGGLTSRQDLQMELQEASTGKKIDEQDHRLLAAYLTGKSADEHLATLLEIADRGLNLTEVVAKATSSTDRKHVQSVIELLRFVEQPKKAVQLGWRLLELQENQLGVQDLETLAAMDSLAFGLRDTGEVFDAAAVFKRSLEAKAMTYGPDDAETIQGVENLAALHQSTGELSRAKRLFKRALEAKEKSLGAEHHATLATVRDLALVLEDGDELKEAKVLFKRAVEGSARTLGELHPFTLEVVDDLILVLELNGEFREAQELEIRFKSPTHFQDPVDT